MVAVSTDMSIKPDIFRLIRLKTMVPTGGVCVPFHRTGLRTLWAQCSWKLLTEGGKARGVVGYSKKSGKPSVCKTRQINEPTSITFADKGVLNSEDF